MSPSVEAFDEAKYKALMGGLECSEIKLSQVREYKPLRIDSHFFEKKYRKLKEVLSPYSCLSLKELVLKDIQTGHTPSMSVDSYYGGCIALIKTDNLHENSIGSVFSDYLTSEGNAVIVRTQLAPRDIITTIIGATERIIARSAIITEEYLPANINQNIVQIRIDSEKISPEYVITYLNTKYGKGYLIYLSRQTEQFNLNCKEVESVLVPILSNCFQNRIEEIAQTAQQLQSTSRLAYKQAEAILSSYLNLDIEEQERPVKAIKSFKGSFASTGRLDAEYYQPKYEALTKKICSKETVASLCRLYDSNYLPQEDKDYNYIELANVGMRGEITGTEIAKGYDLPTRARRIVSVGQVIISSIEGSLQSCALISAEYDGALCSTGFYVLDSDRINSETLLVLFKSDPIQALLKQRCSGTILSAISKDELLNLPIPFVNEEIQKDISAKVQESFALRHKSKELLEYAKKAVEMAIEQGEAAAMDWLKSKVDK